jgi:hypothetical protein
MKKILLVIVAFLFLAGCEQASILKVDNKTAREWKAEYNKLEGKLNNLEQELIFANKPDSYLLYIKQIGGVGSKIVQATANYETEHGYLNPVEDWYSYSFNSPADVIHLNCDDDYYIGMCKNIKTKEWIETYENKICSTALENELQNNFELRCVKGSYSNN